tara:strand:+ start:1280 stop:1891 length:612 start_codon:yes stop_codon:yes gene_type:complete
MSRNLTTAVQNQLAASELEPFFAIKLAFDSGDVRIWTGYTDITVASETYIGGGQLLSISPIEETVEVAARGVNLALNGIDSSLVSVALTESYQGRAAKVYLGVISSGAVVADPYLVFDGRMDVMTIEDAGETASISLSAESRLIDLERARVRRFTDNDQQNQFPGDTSLRFVADLQDKEIAWGSGKDDSSFALPPGFGNMPLF